MKVSSTLDETIYKEVELEKDTPYRISCMVKTEDVVCQENNQEGGVQIGLLETTEYSIPITGTNEWQLIEFMFDSKDMEKAKISFKTFFWPNDKKISFFGIEDLGAFGRKTELLGGFDF